MLHQVPLEDVGNYNRHHDRLEQHRSYGVKREGSMIVCLGGASTILQSSADSF